MRRVEAAALALALSALCVVTASAATYDQVKDQDCSLTIEYAPNKEPMTDNTFRIWKVGTTSEGGLPLKEVGDYAQYNVLSGKGDWLTRAATLLAYLQRDEVAPTAEAQTGEDGKVRFEIPAEDQGLYLVAGDSQWRGQTRYDPTPFLILVPYSSDLYSWETDVQTHSKFTTFTPGPEPVNRHVLKTWNDRGHEDERPESITVDLLRNGRVYRSASLSEDNNWRYDWTNLDGSYRWTVAERENPRYSVRVEQQGITFHITNTWRDGPTPDDPTPDDPTPDNPPPDNPPPGTPTPPPEYIDIEPGGPPLSDIPGDFTDPEDPGEEFVEVDDIDVPLSDTPLPQTGQLWWPVAPMAMAGIILMLLGWRRRRNGEAQ